MLIINADDYGRNTTATDNTLRCFTRGGVTSASAMVFMEDSERAARLAFEYGLDTGLHLNFTLPFDGEVRSPKLVGSQRRIASFLRMSKYRTLIYNPLLRNQFEYVYKMQYEEYMRIYGKEPTHIDGHHHMHICMNMLVSKLIPIGFRVRKSFTVSLREKNILNRFYRYLVDTRLLRRYTCTDCFFSVVPFDNRERLKSIVNIARSRNVGLMVHPEKSEEYNYLVADDYLQMISHVAKGSYSCL
jgi:predicted glycoside hydrolase/deacetylase ChbG (UPF0249 family)